MLRFSANLTLLFNEKPFMDRFGAASAAGFNGVEFLFPLDWPVGELDERRRRYSLEFTLMNIVPGDWAAGERGLACVVGREKEFRRGVEATVAYANKLKCKRLHCVAGLSPDKAPMRAVETCFVDNVLFAADACAQAGIEVMIEPINTMDMPGFFLDNFEKAMSLMNIMARQGGAQPKLQFDIYHCARIHGDVASWLDRTADRIGYFQIGGIPDRHEPDIGLLPLNSILAKIDELGLDTWIGCEYHPRDDTAGGLGWLSAVRSRFPGN